VKLELLVETSRRVAEASGRLEKVRLLAALLVTAPPEEIETATAYLCGSLRQERLGVGWATLRASAADVAADSSSLNLADVDAGFDRIAQAAGKGSADEKQRLLKDLLARATRDEQRFLARLVMGELRQGALEGLVADAVARAAAVQLEDVRRALMMVGDLPTVAKAALTEGASGLSRFSVQLFRPVLPMLAETAEDEAGALSALGEAALEYKVDGARIQVHKSGDDVRVFSRRLNEVTGAVPELVEAVRALPARELILDARRWRSGPRHAPPISDHDAPVRPEARRGAAPARAAAHAVLFDLLYLDGAALLDEPLAGRAAALSEAVAPALVMPRIVTGSATQAGEFSASRARARTRRHHGQGPRGAVRGRPAGESLAQGQTDPDAGSRRAGCRVGPWAPSGLAEQPPPRRPGPGRRRVRDAGEDIQGNDGRDARLANDPAARARGRAGRVHGARAPRAGGRGRFQRRAGKPAVPGGLALRFARVKRYRPDKGAAEADTLATLELSIAGRRGSSPRRRRTRPSRARPRH